MRVASMDRGMVSEAGPLAADATLIRSCWPRPLLSTSVAMTWTRQIVDFVQQFAIRPRRPRFRSMRMCAHACERAHAGAGARARARVGTTWTCWTY